MLNQQADLHYAEGTLGSTLSYRYIVGTMWPKMVPESVKATSQSVCDAITAKLFEPAIKKNITLACVLLSNVSLAN